MTTMSYSLLFTSSFSNFSIKLMPTMPRPTTTTFVRFVRDRSFCEATEIAKRAFRPTRDNPNCLIGYTCYEPGAGDWPGVDD